MFIAHSDSKNILLNTGLKETAFSKAIHGINFMEKGVLVRVNLFENNFTFSDWTFNGTTVDSESDLVCFEGDLSNGTSALEVILGQDESLSARMTYVLIQTLSKAIDSNIYIPKVGLGGILYSEHSSKKNPSITCIELLFLPENLFEFSASNQNENDYAKLQGFWQNKNLSGNNSLIFLQSVIAYYSLSKLFPFMKTSTEERQENIVESNFIEIQNLVNGIDKFLASNIDMGLCVDEQYERDSSLIPLDTLKKELGLNDDGSCTPPERNTKISTEDFNKKIQKKEKHLDKNIKKKRFFKHYSIPLLVVLFLLAVTTNFCYKKHLESFEKPYAKGATSTEAIEIFFSGFHQLNTQQMKLVAKGREANTTVSMIGNIYVTSTTRTAYEGKATTISPELWLTRPELFDYHVFGITSFTIDGKPAHNRFTPETKASYIARKNQGELQFFEDGTEEIHNVNYILLTSYGYPEPLQIENCSVTVTCKYIKNQWYVTGLSNDSVIQSIEQDELRDAYTQAYKETKSPKETVRILREKYSWLPDERAMDDGEKLAEYQKNYFK